MYCKIRNFIVLRCYPQPRIKAIHGREHLAHGSVAPGRVEPGAEEGAGFADDRTAHMVGPNGVVRRGHGGDNTPVVCHNS